MSVSGRGLQGWGGGEGAAGLGWGGGQLLLCTRANAAVATVCRYIRERIIVYHSNSTTSLTPVGTTSEDCCEYLERGEGDKGGGGK